MRQQQPGQRIRRAGRTVSRVLAVSVLVALAGCKASPPGKFETYVATQVKRRITVGGAGERNPLAATAANILQGKQLFQNYCTSCHGSDGLNGGVIFAEKMSPPVPPLNSADVQQFADGQLKWIIQNGVSPSGMPAWRDTLDDEDIDRIVLFIRQLPAPASTASAPTP